MLLLLLFAVEEEGWFEGGEREKRPDRCWPAKEERRARGEGGSFSVDMVIRKAVEGGRRKCEDDASERRECAWTKSERGSQRRELARAVVDGCRVLLTN